MQNTFSLEKSHDRNTLQQVSSLLEGERPVKIRLAWFEARIS